MEIWRDVVGYEGLYQVSNLGRVKSLDRMILDKTNRIQHKKAHIVPQRKRRKGANYLSVSLYKHNKVGTFAVHRLVALAFVPNPHGKEQVNHIDENPENNCANNLEWVTPFENMHHKNLMNRINRTRTKAVQAFDECGNLAFSFASIAEAGRNGFSAAAISQNIAGKTKKSGGYVWKTKA